MKVKGYKRTYNMIDAKPIEIIAWGQLILPTDRYGNFDYILFNPIRMN